jgi:glycosyltransferase involved in cell wall biosynthesis
MDTLKDSKKDVLVCIPSYNAEDSIVKTIKSVLSQTYENFDLLVVDNKSTDNTVEAVQHLKKELGDDRLYLIVNKENLGRVENWNECLRMFQSTSHKYLKFVFTGDALENTCLEKLAACFEKYPNVGFVVFKYYVHKGEDAFIF